MRMFRQIFRVMVQDADFAEQFGTNNLGDLCVRCGAMEAGGDEDGDVVAGYAACFQAIQDMRQD